MSANAINSASDHADTDNVVAGQYMSHESTQAPGVLKNTAQQDASSLVSDYRLSDKHTIYTVARGSSDAAANVLSYEMMRVLQRPVVSLPPSVFSIGSGVRLDNALVIVISQSGASDDLVKTTQGARQRGAVVVAITNQKGSAVASAADATLAMNAGAELAIPATKSVVGSIAAGIALLSALDSTYRQRSLAALQGVSENLPAYAGARTISAALLRARHVFVVGRDTGYGAAIEVALKLKECCALHAEAYSASEVLHGPLQLATNPLLVLILDTGTDHVQQSLDQAESRFRGTHCQVIRLCPDTGTEATLTPAISAALLLCMLYPIIMDTALALGFNPDKPSTLSKVTETT
ncbi:MAG: SIS domain-containing protein [Pseudomonadota bacterium]